MTNPAAALKNPPPAGWRWGVLVAISFAMFGNYYTYDSVAPVADLLQRQLHFTDTQIGALNAIYSAPNIIMVLIGGVIVDRIGTKLSTLLFAIICFLGSILTAVSPSFPIMAAGRLLFGLGAESMIVAITVAIGQWFVGRQLGFAFGVNLSIARAGSYTADKSTDWFKPLYDAGWQPPLWLAAVFSGSCVIACFVYYLLERRPRRGSTSAAGAARPLHLERSVALRSLVLVHRRPVRDVLFGDLSVPQHIRDQILPARPRAVARRRRHVEQLRVCRGHFFTPLFGLMVDKLGRRAAFMAFGTFLLAAVFPILAYTQLNLWVATVIIGIAFSLVPAVIWPAVPYLVEPHRLGTAYGLMTMVQNIGLMVFNLAAGALNDPNHAGPTSRRLHADVVDVHDPDFLRLRVRSGAPRARTRGRRGMATKPSKPRADW